MLKESKKFNFEIDMETANPLLTSMPEWKNFVDTYSLSDDIAQKFATYAQLLLQENEKYNLTARTSMQEIISDHFYDSLALLKLHDMSKVVSIVDVGSGAGFPGLALAIVCPHITFGLVEVNLKKVHFLQMVAQEIELKNIEVYTDDWRTFLRKFQKPVDLFIARASLQVDELLRIFKPSLPYQHATLVYWASIKWSASQTEKKYLHQTIVYHVGQKQRKLCLFQASV